MAVDNREWLSAFLRHRQLEEPDGRALYAYRCKQQEFNEVVDGLASRRDQAFTIWDIRAFVLYAAEWWQRQYDGGTWAWQPLLDHIGWGHVRFPDLYDSVRLALAWWQVELVRLTTSTRYLGTFACQGGLPLAFVGNSSRVTSYLRAVLKHMAANRQFVDDPIELARDQEHLLRPPTLRREYVFRLAADLVDAVLHLRDDVREGEENVLDVLDDRRPDWRDTMPLDLDNERARDLLIGLLRDAKRGTSAGSSFGVERFLLQTGTGWRLGARIQLPRSVPAEGLAKQLGVSESDLQPRMHVRVVGQAARVVGLYGESNSEEFHLFSLDRAAVLWDADAAGELRLEFFSQDIVGHKMTVRRGSALGELPWVFRSEDTEYSFVGEGSVSDRAPELFVLLPGGCEAAHGEAVNDVSVLGRRLWRVTELVDVQTDSGKCVLSPSSEQMVEEDYRLSGGRFWEFDATCPLFRGEARLHVAKADMAPRSVPAHEVSWRGGGGGWQTRPNGFGLWEVRHIRQGELRYHDRVGLLPKSLTMSVRPGANLAEGELTLEGTEGVVVAGDDADSRLNIREDGTDVSVEVTALNHLTPPAEVALRLRWEGARDLRVCAPFPGEGGRFLRNGVPLNGVVAVDDLYGIRAMALSMNFTQTFRITGELKAPDLGALGRVAWFEKALRKSRIRHELALVEVYDTIRALLGASEAPDARVEVRILDRSQNAHGHIEVRRFAAALEHDPSMASVLVTPPDSEGGAGTFEAVPLAHTDINAVELEVVGPAESPVCAKLPESLDLTEGPWLVMLRQDGGLRVEPVIIGGRSQSPPSQDRLSLQEALRLEDHAHREVKVNEALNAMMVDTNTSSVDEAWSLLTDTLLCVEGIPATAVDLLRALSRCPQLLVRCLFRLDPNLRQMVWRLDDELPFSWPLIKRDVWWQEARLAYETLCGELADIVEEPQRMAGEQVLTVLDEGAGRIGALGVVGTDIGIRLNGGVLSEDFERAVREERDRKAQEHLNLRARLDDWPEGDGRDEWSRELDKGELFLGFVNHFESNLPRVRQPTFDTPVAAAWCCFFSEPTPRTVFLVERMRMHDPGWFDIAYSAAWLQFARLQDRNGR